MGNEKPQGAERVIVALDVPSAERALALVDGLSEGLVWAKVGMELFYGAGAPLVAALKERGLKVFLDLKMHDIPNTVQSAARVLAGLGVDMLTIHGLGGPRMVAAARAGLDEGAAAAGLPAPKLLAVTVLTSMDAEQLAAVGVERPVAEEAAQLARMAHENGADGVVCSAFEAAAMRELLGPNALVVTPGIRPAGSAAGDQKRVATPADAIAAGASHLVVGRPVNAAPDPAAALAAIEAEVAAALA
jgi:orotidine-5'-phosphate decarboxylase